MEIVPADVDTATVRWQKFTGKDAIRAATGKTFDEICASAAAESSQVSVE